VARQESLREHRKLKKKSRTSSDDIRRRLGHNLWQAGTDIETWTVVHTDDTTTDSSASASTKTSAVNYEPSALVRGPGE
jgi:hypothetical protein